jgi:malic enzyme
MVVMETRLSMTTAAVLLALLQISFSCVLCLSAAGAGSAGLGVCSQILDGLLHEGLSREEALKKFAVFSAHGVIGANNGKNGNPHYTQSGSPEMLQWANQSFADGDKLLDVIRKFKPTVLLGLSTKGGLFDEEVIKTMHKYW